METDTRNDRCVTLSGFHTGIRKVVLSVRGDQMEGSEEGRARKRKELSTDRRENFRRTLSGERMEKYVRDKLKTIPAMAAFPPMEIGIQGSDNSNAVGAQLEHVDQTFS